MAKDYAKKFSKNRKFVTHGWRVRLLLVIFLVLVTSGVFYGIKLFKKDDWHQPLFISKLTSYFQTKKEAPKSEPVEALPKKPEIQFNFYTELPKAELKLPDAKPGPTQVKSQYILQIASFASEATASEMRISLLLAGIEVQIVKKLVDNHWMYLLQKGPYASIAEAKKMQTKLKTKGYENVKIFSL